MFVVQKPDKDEELIMFNIAPAGSQSGCLKATKPFY